MRSYVHEARRRVGPKRDRIRPVIERLAAEHQDATIALRFATPLELLISVMLSAQTTDVNVNRVTERLFREFQRPEDYLAVPQEELERRIYATGYFRQKARSIQGTARVLLEEFDGEVPTRLDDLVRLPGVGRKTANVVAAELGHAAGDRGRHARPAPVAAARLHAQGGAREDRAGPHPARPARGLGPVPAPADLARPARVRRPQASLRGLRGLRPLPREPRLTYSRAVTREAYLNAFRVVVALGIPPNLYFAYPALFSRSDDSQAGLKPGFETVWLRTPGSSSGYHAPTT